MGFEVMAGIIALGLTAAETGIEHQNANVAKEKAKEAEKQQEQAIRSQTKQLENQQAANDATAQARIARARQMAASGVGTGFGSTVNTSPLGLAGNGSPTAGGLTNLGQ
jgi:hypothetical protein